LVDPRLGSGRPPITVKDYRYVHRNVIDGFTVQKTHNTVMDKTNPPRGKRLLLISASFPSLTSLKELRSMPAFLNPENP